MMTAKRSEKDNGCVRPAIEAQLKDLLDETRLAMLGTQLLMGLQYNAAFAQRFGSLLDALRRLSARQAAAISAGTTYVRASSMIRVRSIMAGSCSVIGATSKILRRRAGGRGTNRRHVASMLGLSYVDRGAETAPRGRNPDQARPQDAGWHPDLEHHRSQ